MRNESCIVCDTPTDGAALCPECLARVKRRHPLPKLKSDKEAEEFVAKADLTDYDLSRMRTVKLQPKGRRLGAKKTLKRK